MATETWSGYPPEVNSGRWEAGTGPETWMAASAVWTSFAEIVSTATASLMGEIAMMTGSTLTGMTSVSMMASSVPFFGWLAHMESTALMHALACATVAQSWGQCTAGIIPLPVVNQNRITEASLQASNIFGQNSPAIAELDREYGQFWTQDGASMMVYDTAVSLATAPKMVMPPPMLANLAGGAGQMADNAAQAAQSAGQSASQMSSQMGDLSQAGSSTGSQAGSSMGQMSSMMQAPMQAMSQMSQMANPQSLMQPMPSMMQPLQSMLGQFMNGPQMGGGLGDSFQGAGLGSTGGVPLSSTGAGGGLGGGMGGGMGSSGGAMGSMGSTSDKVIKPVTNLTGVPPMGSGGKLGATQAGMGGGGMGGGGMGGGKGSESNRKSESIIAANQDAPQLNATEVREERKLFA